MRYRPLVLCAVLIVGCAPTGPAPGPAAVAPAGVPDEQIGLSKVDVSEVAEPLAFRLVDAEPGEGPLPARAYPDAPPVIPHGIADLDPITREVNDCVDCHGVEEKEPGEPTPIPGSHYVDLRHAPEVERTALAGARHNCTACHAPQSDAAPLVGNGFGD